jgi:hypothetical protein
MRTSSIITHPINLYVESFLQQAIFLLTNELDLHLYHPTYKELALKIYGLCSR